MDIKHHGIESGNSGREEGLKILAADDERSSTDIVLVPGKIKDASLSVDDLDVLKKENDIAIDDLTRYKDILNRADMWFATQKRFSNVSEGMIMAVSKGVVDSKKFLKEAKGLRKNEGETGFKNLIDLKIKNARALIEAIVKWAKGKNVEPGAIMSELLDVV